MIDGTYAVNFRSGNNYGDGIVVVSGSKLNGGDAAYCYQGEIDVTHPSIVHGLLHIKRHSSGQSAFGPLDEFTLTFRGNYGNGTLSFMAYMTEPMTAEMIVEARKVSDLLQ